MTNKLTSERFNKFSIEFPTGGIFGSEETSRLRNRFYGLGGCGGGYPQIVDELGKALSKFCTRTFDDLFKKGNLEEYLASLTPEETRAIKDIQTAVQRYSKEAKMIAFGSSVHKITDYQDIDLLVVDPSKREFFCFLPRTERESPIPEGNQAMVLSRMFPWLSFENAHQIGDKARFDSFKNLTYTNQFEETLYERVENTQVNLNLQRKKLPRIHLTLTPSPAVAGIIAIYYGRKKIEELKKQEPVTHRKVPANPELYIRL